MAFMRVSATGQVRWHSGRVKKWLANDPTIRAAAMDAGNALAEKARSIYLGQQKGETTASYDRGISPSPMAAASRKGKRGSKYGLYEESFVVTQGRNGAVLVQNRDRAAGFVEFGTVNQAAYAPMRTAVEAMGGTASDSPTQIPFSTGSFTGSFNFSSSTPGGGSGFGNLLPSWIRRLVV